VQTQKGIEPVTICTGLCKLHGLNQWTSRQLAENQSKKEASSCSLLYSSTNDTEAAQSNPLPSQCNCTISASDWRFLCMEVSLQIFLHRSAQIHWSASALAVQMHWPCANQSRQRNLSSWQRNLVCTSCAVCTRLCK